MRLKFSALLVWAFLLPTIVFAYSNPGKPQGWVNDYANVLTSDQRQQLENNISAYVKNTGNELAVVTISSLDGDTIENYAVQLFQDWGIGKKGKDNGALILIAKDDRKMRIEVGYGLEGDLTDAQSSWIINQIMKPAFQQGDYFGGLSQAASKVMAVTQGQEQIPNDTSSAKSSKGGNFVDWFWYGGFILIWLASVLGRSKSWWAGGVIGGVIGVVIGFIKGFLYFGLVSIVILVPLGLLLDFLVSRQYQKGKATGMMPWWIGGPRGPWGGGSGGGGFGGGFGGGSSGGGGASGSW